jgi:hypothetical protein
MGWDVAISMREYFKLMGLACTAKLRKKLDRAFYPAENRTPEHYAMFRKEENGDCPLRLSSGWCGLQKECGERALPYVCRYYPRAIRAGYAYECSCSASCEAVAEALIAKKDKIAFFYKELVFDLPEDIPLLHQESERAFYSALRERCFSLLQDRSLRLPDRLLALGRMLRYVRLNKLTEAAQLDGMPDFRENTDADSDASSSSQGFLYFGKAAEWIEENSRSLEEHGRTAEKTYTEAGYPAAKKIFEEKYPEWESTFENLLVNHVFYERFPFSDKTGNFRDAVFALFGTYAFLRYMAIGCTCRNEKSDALADVMAAAFRVCDHSSFDKNIVTLLNKEGFDSLEKFRLILEI